MRFENKSDRKTQRDSKQEVRTPRKGELDIRAARIVVREVIKENRDWLKEMADK